MAQGGAGRAPRAGPQLGRSRFSRPNRSGNPTTYEAIRGQTWVYVEYLDGEKEYYDRATDPDELRNIYASLPADQKASLHAMVSALQNCHDAASCSAADGSTRSATPQ